MACHEDLDFMTAVGLVNAFFTLWSIGVDQRGSMRVPDFTVQDTIRIRKEPFTRDETYLFSPSLGTECLVMLILDVDEFALEADEGRCRFLILMDAWKGYLLWR